jgi:hypothetical protein
VVFGLLGGRGHAAQSSSPIGCTRHDEIELAVYAGVGRYCLDLPPGNQVSAYGLDSLWALDRCSALPRRAQVWMPRKACVCGIRLSRLMLVHSILARLAGSVDARQARSAPG